MDDGLIQLLVIGVFVVFSIMEGARKKRRQGQALQRPDETEVDFLRSLTGDEQGEPEEGEGLVPDEIWAEIADLARGGTPPTPEPVPDPEPRLMTPYEPASLVTTDSREEEREEAREAAASATFHRLHSSNLADLKKDPHYAQTSERSAMLRLIGRRGAREDELRRAVILSEILGPPISLREPREP